MRLYFTDVMLTVSFLCIAWICPESVSADSQIVHEDAEDGDIVNWSIYDNRPSGTITNILNPDAPADNPSLLGRVIKLEGGGTRTGYKFSLSESGLALFKIQWSMKFSESFIIYIKCSTTRGTKYLYYTSSERNYLGWGKYIHHGLGRESRLGIWTAVRRDLQRDLHDASPNADILSVDTIYIRGSGLIDDIVTMDYPDADRDLIPDAVEIAAGLDPHNPSDAEDDLDEDKIININEYLNETDIASPDSDLDQLTDYFERFLSLTDANNPDSDNNGTFDAFEDPDADTLDNLAEQSAWMNPHLKAELDPLYNFYLQEKTVREDAESGNTDNWRVCGKKKKNKAIRNIIDPVNPSLHGRVIKIKKGLGVLCSLDFSKQELAPPERVQFKITWDMKYRHSYIIFVSCSTTKGRRLLYYTASQSDYLGSGRYVHHGLGKTSRLDAWVTVRRDLQRDLWDAQPDADILYIDTFLVRGKGLLDNITTLAYADKDRDLLPDSIETALGLNPDDSNDAGAYLDDFFNGNLVINLDSDGDGILDADELANGFNPHDPNDPGLLKITITHPAEGGVIQ